ncbi:MAG TPA: tetratricopeptide repeat protein [Tepidisphaeraceae bacterium]|jgi:tetratricopeptide (TPR) repeat protein
MNIRWLLGSAILVALMAGCANNKAQQASTSAPAAGSELDHAKTPPITAKTHFAAGQLAESQGDLPTAIAQYQKALSLDPKYADAMFRLGCVQTAARDFPKAIDTWNRYVALTQGSATACNNLAFCQELAGNPIAAESAYRKGIERDPTNEPCHVNYGLMLARHGRPNEALLQLQSVLPPAKAHYDLASAYEQSGHKQEAKAEYAKALELDPNLEDAKAKLASLDQ